MATQNPEIQRIELRSGLVERGADPGRLPVCLLLRPGINVEIAGAIEKERLLELGGSYGLPGAGVMVMFTLGSCGVLVPPAVKFKVPPPVLVNSMPKSA